MQISKDHILGSFIGCAVGDSLGMPFEGWPQKRIQKYVGEITEIMAPTKLEGKEDEFGKIFNWTSMFSKGEFTDDTILTMSLAQSLVDRRHPDIQDIAEKHVDVYHKYQSGYYKGGFGGTTKDAMAKLEGGCHPFDSASGNHPGSGPAMKMAPLGLWAALNQMPDDVLRYFSNQVGKLTHNNRLSIILGNAQALTARHVIEVEHPIVLVHKILHEFVIKKYKGSDRDKFVWICQQLFNKDTSDQDAFERFGSTFNVGDSYPLVIWMVCRYWDKPIEGLVNLISFGGDCDTTGAMYGSLMGFRHGNIWPEKWTKEISQLNQVKNIAEKFYATFSKES